MVNFANGDMVGHTGDFNAAIKAVEAVDTCLGEIVECAKSMIMLLSLQVIMEIARLCKMKRKFAYQSHYF